MKSSFPYLVDIGLGNYCPLAGDTCHVPCYASSSQNGALADINNIYHVLNVLHDVGTFEVVFGGTEPTLYPNIVSILQHAQKLKFKVGLTTRNYNLHEHASFNEIIASLDTIAISANSTKDLATINPLITQIRTLGYTGKQWNTEIYVQNIFGLRDYDSLKEFLTAAKEKYFRNVTLLGYKSFGFGTKFKPHVIPDEWIEFVKKLDINVGIDSILSQTWREKLIAQGVAPQLLVGCEGESTCYFDCLTNTIAASSFVDDKVQLAPKFTKQRFLEVFANF